MPKSKKIFRYSYGDLKEIHDYYFQRAKKEGYVARSAFKLQEIDEKFHFFGPHAKIVIDIGCAPGSWLQYTSRQLQKFHKVGHQEPLIIGFDLKKVEFSLPFVSTHQQDITDHDAVKEILRTHLGLGSSFGNQSVYPAVGTHDTTPPLVDIIISDMAPDTTADASTDALRSSQLIMSSMRMYEQLLKKDGKFAIKVFMGPGFEELVYYCRVQRGHKLIKIFKPKSCRKESKETYIVKI